MGYLRRFSQKNKLEELRSEAKKTGLSKEKKHSIMNDAMVIYRRDSDLMTKEDLILFGIIILKK